MEQECCFGRIVFDNIPHMCDMGLMYLDNLSLVHLLWVVHPVSPCLMSTKEIMRKHQSYITDMEEVVFETTINLPKFFNNVGWQEVFKFSPAMWCECTVLPCNTLHCILLRFIYNLVARVSHPPTLTEHLKFWRGSLGTRLDHSVHPLSILYGHSPVLHCASPTAHNSTHD